jgi:hypothetical protein
MPSNLSTHQAKKDRTSITEAISFPGDSRNPTIAPEMAPNNRVPQNVKSDSVCSLTPRTSRAQATKSPFHGNFVEIPRRQGSITSELPTSSLLGYEAKDHPSFAKLIKSRYGLPNGTSTLPIRPETRSLTPRTKLVAPALSVMVCFALNVFDDK